MAHHPRIRSLTALLAASLISLTAAAQSPAEALLEQALTQIRNQQDRQALRTLDSLIERYPDFQLAQLIRADLLYAQGNLLDKPGTRAIPAETASNLTAEAQARLNASKAPPAGTLPAYVMHLPSWLSYLITIDLSQSRAYLFQIHNGQLQFLTSYYTTQGKLGAGKEKEGDKRTPIGAYFMQAPIHPSRLTPFYGAGALPLDYPNSWDKRQGRTGHGIWLHGTPIGQYSRPPKASDGCVVVANEDLQQIMARLDWRKTLVITDSSLDWATPEETIAPRPALMQAIEGWRQAWEQQDIKRYMNYYASDFVSGTKENRRDWESRKAQIFSYNRPHTVRVDDLLLLRYPQDNRLAMVVFDQTYSRDGKVSKERKRQWWQWKQDRWQIIGEELL